MWPEADCLLLGCSPAKQTLTLARRSAIDDPKQTFFNSLRLSRARA
jgi:hypothetical protein